MTSHPPTAVLQNVRNHVTTIFYVARLSVASLREDVAVRKDDLFEKDILSRAGYDARPTDGRLARSLARCWNRWLPQRCDAWNGIVRTIDSRRSRRTARMKPNGMSHSQIAEDIFEHNIDLCKSPGTFSDGISTCRKSQERRSDENRPRRLFPRRNRTKKRPV